MSEQVPSISEADVRILATPQSFDRGFNYFRGGAIFDAVRQGNQLRAYCHGSHYEPYHVSATLGPGGSLTNAYCSCPYNWGGICKHIVALLLTWIHEPETFHTVAPLDETLASRSREELIALIKEMLQREPDLLRLLELPLLPDDQTPLDLDAFRRQINYALHHDFPDAEALADELSAIIATGNRFLEAGDWANAGALYCLILAEIVPDYGNLYDEEGFVGFQLSRCAEGLDSCFAAGSPDAETRRAWLEALLEAELQDVEMGGIDLAYPAGELVIEHATEEEWTWIEKRVRQTVEAYQGPYSGWGRETLVSFLMQRLEFTDREAEIDDLIFELGSRQQQAFRLTQLGHFDEAVAIAREHFAHLPGLVIDFADALVEAGAGPAAVEFITGLLNTRDGPSYLFWLAEYAEGQGDLATALDWWRQLYQEAPDLERYQKVRMVATKLDKWQDLRPQFLQELENRQRWGLLIEIALDEGDVARAIELLPRHEGWSGFYLELAVAEAAEPEFPQIAIDIYLSVVESLIGFRGRGNYREAAELLIRVRELYRRQNNPTEWERYIADLRERHRRLPALKDELNKAGL